MRRYEPRVTKGKKNFQKSDFAPPVSPDLHLDGYEILWYNYNTSKWRTNIVSSATSVIENEVKNGEQGI